MAEAHPASLPQESTLRQTVLDRTLAPLLAAAQFEHDAAYEISNTATADRARATFDAVRQRQSPQPFDVAPYNRRIATREANALLLADRMVEVVGIIGHASVEELSNPHRVFDPHKARHVAYTVQEIMATSGITNRKKFEKHADRVTVLAETEYDTNPLHPSPDFRARQSLERRSRGVVSWAMGALLDKLGL